MSNTAIVSLVIGDDYKQFWKTYCQESWEAYAKKYDHDIVLIEEKIRNDNRTPHWQKLLIFDHPKVQQYDRVVWIDSDIVINHSNSPCIFKNTQKGTIGVVSRQEKLARPEDWDNGMFRAQRWGEDENMQIEAPADISDRYRQAGLGNEVNDLCNTGVIVLEPKHDEILKNTYKKHEANPYSGKENLPLSYEIFKYDNVTKLDTRFNKLWESKIIQNYPFLKMVGLTVNVKTIALIVNTVFYNSYFLHFLAGHSRQFINLIVPNESLTSALSKIKNGFDDQDFTIGTHTLSN